MTDMTMVERVARAVCIALGKEPEEWADSSALRERCRLIARAAIAAMGSEDDVTDEMLTAGQIALHAPENRHGAVLGAVFCAMIQAALNEQG